MCDDDMPYYVHEYEDLTFCWLLDQIPFLERYYKCQKIGFENMNVVDYIELQIEVKQRLPKIKRCVEMFEKLKIIGVQKND